MTEKKVTKALKYNLVDQYRVGYRDGQRAFLSNLIQRLIETKRPVMPVSDYVFGSLGQSNTELSNRVLDEAIQIAKELYEEEERKREQVSRKENCG